MKNKKGFTLIELLIVIALIGILAAAAYVAVDPVERIQDARDAQRWSDVTAVLDAILKYNVDYGAYPGDTADNQIDATAASAQILGTTDDSSPAATPPQSPARECRHASSGRGARLAAQPDSD